MMIMFYTNNIWQSITLIELQAFCLQTSCLQDLPRDSSRLARAARAIQIAWYVISEAIPHEKLEDFVFLEITFGHVQHDLIPRKKTVSVQTLNICWVGFAHVGHIHFNI